MSKEVTFKVFRFDPEKDKKPYFQKYAFEPRQGMTILDGLFHIQRKIDGSIAFRSSCREGVCGSCAMHIGGKYRLACETQIKGLGKNITIRPLAHVPIIKDLVVDMKPFWNKYKSVKPYLMPGDPDPASHERIQSEDERKKIDVLIDCILCGACTSSCSVTATNEDYLGPAALMKANRFIRDTRDNATDERLRLVATENGAYRCHTIFSCQYVCPKDLNPQASIQEIQELGVKRILKEKE
ncbi:MAG: succinate dehydrogenase iron-sulfur subunit [Acidobacteria bacterium]|nr:succinate dehydrogenase iron-sulfur subunit [Acidobacteriota bacterium]